MPILNSRETRFLCVSGKNQTKTEPSLIFQTSGEMAIVSGEHMCVPEAHGAAAKRRARGVGAGGGLPTLAGGGLGGLPQENFEI